MDDQVFLVNLDYVISHFFYHNIIKINHFFYGFIIFVTFYICLPYIQTFFRAHSPRKKMKTYVKDDLEIFYNKPNKPSF